MFSSVFRGLFMYDIHSLHTDSYPIKSRRVNYNVTPSEGCKVEALDLCDTEVAERAAKASRGAPPLAVSVLIVGLSDTWLGLGLGLGLG